MERIRTPLVARYKYPGYPQVIHSLWKTLGALLKLQPSAENAYHTPNKNLYILNLKMFSRTGYKKQHPWVLARGIVLLLLFVSLLIRQKPAVERGGGGNDESL